MAERELLLTCLAAGRERLGRAFGGRFVPVLVPPWNRIAADVVPSRGSRVYRPFDLRAAGVSRQATG